MRPSIRGDCGRATRQGGLSVGGRVEQGLYIVSLRRDLTFDLGLSQTELASLQRLFFNAKPYSPDTARRGAQAARCLAGGDCDDCCTVEAGDGGGLRKAPPLGSDVDLLTNVIAQPYPAPTKDLRR